MQYPDSLLIKKAFRLGEQDPSVFNG